MAKKLTEEQLSELEKLIETLQHPKLKKLLKRAIPVWRIKKVETAFGVTRVNTDVIKSIAVGSCLMGAAVIGVKKSGKIRDSTFLFSEIWAVSGISILEYHEIMSIFDTGKSYTDKTPLLTEEMKQIRKIIWD